MYDEVMKLPPGSSVLECGSGLSTVVLAEIGRRRGLDVVSLEQDSAWATFVEQKISRSPASRVQRTTIVSHGDFEWYAVDELETPAAGISLVICDGPPAHGEPPATRGGRRGLLPVLDDHLTPDVVILFDDPIRRSGAETLEFWRQEFGMTVELVQRTHLLRAGRSFARVTRG